jgi:VWFA-related protein
MRPGHAALPTALAVGLLATSPAPFQQTRQKPTFRASTQLVEVDVNVTDESGAFVPDLRLEDFELLDEGTPRPIEVAYVVRSGQVSIAPRADEEAGTLPQMPANAAPPSGRRVIVFYFDTTHMKFGQLRRAGTAAEQFIGSGLNDGDIGGIVVGEQMVNNRLTTDHAELLRGIRAATLAGESKSIASATGASSAAATASPEGGNKAEATAEINQRLREADEAVVSGATTHTEVATLEMLGRLVDALSRVPGRKNVVFFSAGFSLFGTQARGMTRRPDTLPAMREIVDHAARATVHIYSIDVAGLDKGVGSSGLITAEDEFSLAGLNARMRSGEPDAEDVLTSLALDTGGLLFLNRNFYGETLKQIDEDSSNYYVLAFRPEDKGKAKKGAYRALHIKVNRPRVTVRARKGYVVQ